MTEWIQDDEFGLIPVKEYERLSKNRKHGTKHTNYKSGMVITKTTPIIREPAPAAAAQPATLIRTINDVRVQLRLTEKQAYEAKKEAERLLGSEPDKK